MCIDEPYEIYGHYNSFGLNNLVVAYEFCENRPSCKKDEEKNAFIKNK